MLLVLKRSSEQEAQLDQLLAAQADPASPNYRHWLTPAEFGKRFGVADADLETVSGFLSAEGFRLGRVYGSRTAVEVTGTAEQIRHTFGTEIHRYVVGGKTYYANATDPRIPAALAPVVAGFASLNNFHAEAKSAQTPVAFDTATHQTKPLYDIPRSTNYGVSPADLSKIYNIPASTSTYGKGGQGVSIGFIGDSNINVSYIANYRTIFGLPANNPIVVVDGDDPGVTSDAYIAYKQLEIAGAVAPNATIYYYTSATTDYDTGLDFALARALEDNSVQVLGIGFQSCETALAADGMFFINMIARQAAAQGITIVAASGNSGSAGCDVPGSANAATGGLAVNGFASSPNVTAVGGTDFNYLVNNRYSYSNFWTQNTTAYASAISYIPEQVWNDSNTGSDSNPGTPYLLASGGGVSTAGSDGVSTPTPEPSYQVGVVPTSITSSARALPDVSFFAGSGNNNAMGYNNTAYVFCMQNSDCVTSANPPQFTTSGGTETSSAVFAGAMALVVEYQNATKVPSANAQNTGLGAANAAIYNFVKKGLGTYHDITTGNNEVSCANLNCTNSYMSKYAAGTGYDAATGLGSFDITDLVSKWAAPNTTATTTSLTITDSGTGAVITTVPHSQGVKFTVQVTGSGTLAPTGDVAVTDNSPLPAQDGQDLIQLTSITNNPVATAVEPNYIYLPGGTYQVGARYAGDATYAGSVSSPVTLTVTPEASQMVVYGHNVNYSGSTLAYGSPVHITVEPYSIKGGGYTSTPTGSIQVYDGASLVTVLPINSEGATTFSSNLLAVGSHSLVLKYPGDASFQASQTAAFNFSITSASTQTTLNPSTTNVGEGGNNSDGLTATVISTTLPSNGSSPTGTVTFSTNPAVTVALIPGFDPNGNAIATASTTISPAQVPASGIISATYNATNGGNYTGSTSPGVQFTQTTSTYSGTSSVTVTLTDSSGTYTTTQAAAKSFPTSDNLSLNINVATDTPNASYVTVYANGAAISGQLYPDVNGNVSFPIPQQNGYMLLPSGQVQLMIQYDGWEEYIFGYPYYQSPPASTNLTINIADNRTSADFSLQSATMVNQANPLTAASPSASYKLQLTSIYNFQSAYASTPINLSCAIVNNPGLQCSLSPTSVTLGGSGFATATLTVSPGTGYAIASRGAAPLPEERWWLAGGGATLACVFLLGLPGRRRSWQAMLGTVALAMVALGAGGCGSSMNILGSDAQNAAKKANGQGNMTPNGTVSVAPGNYTVVVSATTTTNTTIIHNLPLTVIVTNQ